MEAQRLLIGKFPERSFEEKSFEGTRTRAFREFEILFSQALIRYVGHIDIGCIYILIQECGVQVRNYYEIPSDARMHACTV